jgi:YegS/Rv2252/BmrU family lipid kinase
MMKALVIHNPSAGMRTDYHALHAALDVFRAAGWQVEACETQAGGDATKFARDAAQGHNDAVFAVGGDGTLNEVLNGILDSNTALGVLPYGTANVWAKEMGLPLGDMAAAAQLQIGGEPVRIDVGEAVGESFGPRAFVLSCGIGFDAYITAEVEPQRALKRRLGAAMFWMVGTWAAFTYRGRHAQVEVDGKKRRVRLLLALASNAQLYGGVVRIAPDARVDDGLLDLAVFRGTGVWRTAWHLIRVFLGWHLRAPDVDHYRAREIAIRGPKLPVHVDAEPVGVTPVRISVRPKALRVLVPPSANRSLFSNGT